MNTQQKIYHFREVKWNIPFRELYNTVTTVCEFVKPVYPTVEPLKYLEYFFAEIDFDKIENNTDKAETLKYCNAIYYGLEQVLKADISKAILHYQNSISKLSKEQIQETQKKVVELIGNLKRQARTTEAGISFTQRYNAMYKSIEAKESLFSIDYQILISHFNETILNDLLSSFEIMNETFKEITPLLETKPRRLDKPENEQPNTFCPKMPLSIPKEHFKVLTDKKSKNGQPFLSNEQFDLFIERAFCGNAETPKQKMNQAPKGEKLLIQTVFYEFYDNYCFDYFQTMQCQDAFIKLLTDNFDGWDFQNVKNNFTPKTKKRL